MKNCTSVIVPWSLILTMFFLFVFFYENLSRVSEEGNLKLSKALSLEELHKALKGMESGKAPGIDSLPVDFYKSFWSVLNENFGI